MADASAQRSSRIDADKMSLKYEHFERHFTPDNSPLATFLKGHLWVEQCLNTAITIALEEPSALQIDRETFGRKTALAYAVGGISKEDRDSVVAINRLRNRLAHDLEADLTVEDIAKLNLDMRGDIRRVLDAVAKRIPDQSEIPLSEQLFAVFFSAVTTLHFRNSKAAYEKKNWAAIRTYRVMVALRDGGYPLGEITEPPEAPTLDQVWDGFRFPEFSATATVVAPTPETEPQTD